MMEIFTALGDAGIMSVPVVIIVVIVAVALIKKLLKIAIIGAFIAGLMMAGGFFSDESDQPDQTSPTSVLQQS